jgi:hypothetical protein
MSVWGLRVDQDATNVLEAQYVEERDRLAFELRTVYNLIDESGKTNTYLLRRRILGALTSDATDEERRVCAQHAAREIAQKNELDDVRALELYGEILSRIQGAEPAKFKGVTETDLHKAECAAWQTLGFVLPTTPTGALQTGAEILESVEDVAIEALVDYDRAGKRLSTYLEPMREAGACALTPSYGILKRSGRTSSSSPNIQNFPRKGGERECFHQFQGHTHVCCDTRHCHLHLQACASEHWLQHEQIPMH